MTEHTGPPEGRLMGIDYGSRRIGISVSDPTRMLASPLTTMERRAGKRAPIGRIVELARSHDVEAIVVGLPLDPEGCESDWTAEVRSFADRLSERSGLSVELVDERFTSIEAEARLRSIGLPKKQRMDKGRVDAAAATVILQGWLDARRSHGH